jgi:hypothetical protein
VLLIVLAAYLLYTLIICPISLAHASISDPTWYYNRGLTHLVNGKHVILIHLRTTLQSQRESPVDGSFKGCGHKSNTRAREGSQPSWIGVLLT